MISVASSVRSSAVAPHARAQKTNFGLSRAVYVVRADAEPQKRTFHQVRVQCALPCPRAPRTALAPARRRISHLVRSRCHPSHSLKSCKPSATVICSAAAAGASTGGTPVPKNTILVVGATGTTSDARVVRKALDEGYEVRCTVRPRQNPADFLR